MPVRRYSDEEIIRHVIAHVRRHGRLRRTYLERECGLTESSFLLRVTYIDVYRRLRAEAPDVADAVYSPPWGTTGRFHVRERFRAMKFEEAAAQDFCGRTKMPAGP